MKHRYGQMLFDTKEQLLAYRIKCEDQGSIPQIDNAYDAVHDEVVYRVEPMTVPDQVNHPSHYTSGPIECWDAMASAFGKEEMATYLKITAFKYNWRAGKKGPASVDLRKGIQCLKKAAELMEEK